MKVYQASHQYTETFYHPNPTEWERVTKILVTTLDKEYAQEIADAHTRNNWNHATVQEFELTQKEIAVQ